MGKRFGIDIDGTVTCPTSMIPHLNKAFSMNITLQDIKQYDLNPLVNIGEREFAAWFAENEPLIYSTSPLAEGARDILLKWQEHHELYFISARRSDLLALTEEWFCKQGLTYHHVELIGSHDKVATAKKYNVDIFFEDKHDNAVMIHEACRIPVILFDTPYNRAATPEGVIRVQNWRQAANWVENWLK
ncbi:hypothetical protein CVD25_04215 [Bacillus canaveralius]|uniref:Nucleotidase n=1 Tax=Bacillus canaveralius TaxID=1403243 RepID=A0A2N5GR74_9BACI|nr:MULTISPECIES: hypothetical protein [Bacillus]PLR85929.1 hypothetical protein CU635_02505 [Bacillus canaveralius]PLR87610.1 hypothetical protein CVD23_01695 [Bacillus sp. V33-4]PLS00048.1 hypothetical protein CVD25_04215 [Bacillus canaveralius]RSK56215.1 hypothetical protein EJA13_02335 [Bacillus canaveralius]